MTEGATTNAALLSEIATFAPAGGATLDNVTTQVEAAPEAIAAGEHCKFVTLISGVTVTEAVTEPPAAVAVIVTVWLALTVPAFAANVAFVAPLATVTEAGTGRAAALLSESVTAVPPDAAACDRVTVQVEIPPGVIVAGAHCIPLIVVMGTTMTEAADGFPFNDAVTVTL